MVGADVEHAKLEVVVALCLDVDVEHHLLGGGRGAASAAVDGIGASLLGPPQVEPVVIGHRGAVVGLLHT